jgi:polyisoprenoid-binding protein YceI
MRVRKRFLTLLDPLPWRFALPVLLAWAGGAQAARENYRLDPVHTRVAFQVSHAGFSRPVASFSQVQGELAFDAADWSTATLEARIPIATLELGDADWQARILDRSFFDAARFPVARYVSTQVVAVDATHARVTGDLTLHGVTHPVTLEVTLNALRRHPLTFKRTAGFSATGTLKRSDFGMDAWKSVVGDDITLIIEVEAQRGGDDAAAQ